VSFAIEFTKTPTGKADTGVLFVFSDKKLTPGAKTVDGMLGGVIQHQLDSHKTFKGSEGQSLTLALPPKAPYLRVIVMGLGDKDKVSQNGLETIGGKLLQALAAQGSQQAILLNAEEIKSAKIKGHFPVQNILFGMRLGSYEFEQYKTVKKDKDDAAAVKLKSVCVLSAGPKTQANDSKNFEDLAKSIFLTRDLVNEPPNKIYPESFAKRVKDTLGPLGVKVEIFDDKQLQKMGMGCLLAVGQASEHLPRLVIMSWPGTHKRPEKPLAFVGKGITFDSGGLCLKPYEGMVDMKMDMAGAAAVTGLMHMLASRKCKVPVVAAIALAENAISDEATRPSDIVTSYSGKTVEILNTDAEGRLVLADALTYIQKTYDPKLVVDLATLTGAIMVALGTDYAGAFVNQDDLWKKLSGASAASGEKLWRMPLDPAFRKEMDSPFADIKNVGSGRYGGSSTAAAFLEEFIDKDRPWAHLDIAGVAMLKAVKPTAPKPFASGYGVRLLNDFVAANFG
jgi:leucyl aminopeptidase